jgi:hypothetical protein
MAFIRGREATGQALLSQLANLLIQPELVPTCCELSRYGKRQSISTWFWDLSLYMTTLSYSTANAAKAWGIKCSIST